MDPDATLSELTALARSDLAEFGGEVHRMAELVIALDDWLRQGGFLPSDWSVRRGGYGPLKPLTFPGINDDGTQRCHPGDCDGSGLSTRYPDGGCHCHVCS